mgnify:CR=1 FL=1
MTRPSRRGWFLVPTLALLTAIGVLGPDLPRAAAVPTGSFDWSTAAPLGAYPGILRASPSTAVNCLRIDLATPDLRLVTTGRAPSWADASAETVLASTAGFVAASQDTRAKVVAAINADAFGGNAYGVTDVRALAVLEGTKVSSGNVGGNAATLVVGTDGTARMQLTSATSEPVAGSVDLAVSGFSFVLVDGAPTGDVVQIAQRTGLGLSADGRYLYLFTYVGGTGITQKAVGEWLLHYGARTGINMDGGGSSQMVWWNPASAAAEYLSSRQTRIVGSNLGVFYEQAAGLPLPWATRDIGAVGAAGSASVSGATYTVVGGGAGVADGADAFRFVYRNGPRYPGVTGPSARLVDQSGGGANAIAGLMVRDDRTLDVTEPGSRFVFVGRRGGDGLAVAMWRPKAKGRLSRAVSTGAVPEGSRFRIRRTGLYVWALEYSVDGGSTWIGLASPTVDLGASVVPFSGLAVASGSGASLSTAVFDDVSVP